MSNKNELLLKLKKLSERGIDGEKKNATELLNNLMKKYNISESELNSLEIKRFDIELKNDIEQRLASQILYAFFNNTPLYQYINAQTKFCVELTKSQEVEFRYMFSIYLEDFKKQELVFYRAFISKNNIFPKNADQKNYEEITSKEREELRLAAMMAEGIQKTEIRKALNS